MDRDEALKLLRGGEDGVKEWNHRRKGDEKIPILSGADLHSANLSQADLADATFRSSSLPSRVTTHQRNQDHQRPEREFAWHQCDNSPRR
jgi:hypothetical protein